MTSKSTTIAYRAAAAIWATAVTVTLAPPSAAAAAPDPARVGPAAARGAGSGAAPGPSAPELAPAMAAVMHRDLGLTPSQVRTRLAAERRALPVERTLRSRLGAVYGGSWLPTGANPRLVVGVTDPARAAEVRAAGAEPKTVARSEQQLMAVKDRLDRHANRIRRAPRAIAGWYADVTSNTVVVLVQPRARQTAVKFVADSGARDKDVRVQLSRERPRPLYDVRGGDAYYIEQRARCSVGFSVRGGFVSAGHCGTVGNRTAGFNGVNQGVFTGSSFPGNDYSWVSVNSLWTPRGVVVGAGGVEIPVRGSLEAPVGASVCRSGSTTGWRCGSIVAKNQTVNYPQGSVFQMTRTSACAQPGDSGGPYISGNQAQGTLSGGSGNCTSGGITFYQPINETLQAGGLQLLTS